MSKRYTILTAAASAALFNSLVNTNSPSNFISSVSYDANDAYLNLSLDYSGLSGLNSNQQNVANALSKSFNTTGSIPFLMGTLTPTGLTQASGEVGTGTQQTTFAAMTQFLNVLLDPFHRRSWRSCRAAVGCGSLCRGGTRPLYAPRARSAERDAYAMFTKAPLAKNYDPRWSVWAAGFGGSQTTDGNTAQDRTTPPAASSAWRRAPTTSSRRAPSPVLRSPAAAPISASPMAAADAPTCSRPARSSATPWVRPTSPARWPMAGRTSRPTAP